MKGKRIVWALPVIAAFVPWFLMDLGKQFALHAKSLGFGEEAQANWMGFGPMLTILVVVAAAGIAASLNE